MSADGVGGAAAVGPVPAPQPWAAERAGARVPGGERYDDRASGGGGGAEHHGDRDHRSDRDDRDRDGRGDRRGERDDDRRGERDNGGGGEDRGRDGRGERSDAGGEDEADRRARAEWEEHRQREGERFRDAMQDPLASDGAAGSTRAANRARSEGRARFSIRGNSSVFDRTRFGHAHFGNVYMGGDDGGSAVLGEVPEAELRRLSLTYRAPDGYQLLKDALRERRVLVLVGPPGTGRRTTALCLLEELTVAGAGDDVKDPGPGPGPDADADADADADGEGDGDGDFAPGRVTRLDVSSLGRILRDPARVARRVARGGGFVLHLPDLPGDWTPPGEAHLGALAAALARRDAYAVLVASPSTPAGALLTGRHALRCPAPPAGELLSWHLTRRLADADDAGPDALDRGERILRHPALRQALGIPTARLRPAETDALAELLVRHLRGDLSRPELLDRCGDLVRGQVRVWFADARHRPVVTDTGEPGRPGRETADDATRVLLRHLAFRVALAVLDGEAFSAVADAADLLTRELLSARMPGREHGRPVFAEDWDGVLAASRAEFGEAEDESLAGVPLPVRTVHYQGPAFAGAVLAEVWQSHHAARAPVVRWLRALADDPRPQVWVRAALAAGELCSADPGYGFAELVAPLASARSPRRRYAAATALDQAGRREPYRTAVRGVVDEWAHADAAGLRWTAALVLGHGRAEPDTRAAVELLGRLGTRDEGAHLQVASYALTRLAAGSRAAEALTLLGEWAAEITGDRRDLALLTGVRLCTARCDDYWEPETSADDTPDDRGGHRGEEGAAAAGAPARAARRPGRVGAETVAGPATALRMPGLWQPVPTRPAVPRADTAAVDDGMGLRRDWPLPLALAVTVPEAAGPLAGLLWRVFDGHLSGERALDGLCGWLRAAEQDAAVTADGRRTYVFDRDRPPPSERPDAAAGELLRALVWFLPLLVREERDWQRLGWALEAMAADPAEPMDERFMGQVLDTVGAGLRAGGREQR